MNRVIKLGVAVFVFNCFQSSVFSEEGSFGLDGEFVYKDMIGGPYFDEWYVSGDMGQLNSIKVYREGKSGSLEVTIEVDCKLQTITIQGTALVYGSTTLSEEEAQDYFTTDITKSIVDKVCTF